MRSQLDNRISGSGTKLAFIEDDEPYNIPQRINVRLSNDGSGMKPEEFDQLCEDLSGPVTTYNLKSEK